MIVFIILLGVWLLIALGWVIATIALKIACKKDYISYNYVCKTNKKIRPIFFTQLFIVILYFVLSLWYCSFGALSTFIVVLVLIISAILVRILIDYFREDYDKERKKLYEEIRSGGW